MQLISDGSRMMLLRIGLALSSQLSVLISRRYEEEVVWLSPDRERGEKM